MSYLPARVDHAAVFLPPRITRDMRKRLVRSGRGGELAMHCAAHGPSLRLAARDSMMSPPRRPYHRRQRLPPLFAAARSTYANVSRGPRSQPAGRVGREAWRSGAGQATASRAPSRPLLDTTTSSGAAPTSPSVEPSAASVATIDGTITGRQLARIINWRAPEGRDAEQCRSSPPRAAGVRSPCFPNDAATLSRSADRVNDAALSGS